eukprot:4557426-Alexandrium_andersonii.AAC.1
MGGKGDSRLPELRMDLESVKSWVAEKYEKHGSLLEGLKEDKTVIDWQWDVGVFLLKEPDHESSSVTQFVHQPSDTTVDLEEPAPERSAINFARMGGPRRTVSYTHLRAHETSAHL